MITYNSFSARLDEITSKSVFHFIAIMVAISVAIGFATVPISLLIDSIAPGGDLIKMLTPNEILFYGVLVAPVVETFLCQYLPARLLSKWVTSRIVIVLISSTLFCIAHLNFPAQAYSAFVGGIVLMYAYFLAADRRYNPFICTAVVHAVHNLIFITLYLVGDL